MLDHQDEFLADWRRRAEDLQAVLARVILGQTGVIENLATAIFARGHVLLEGDVGVGKTTLLRAAAKGMGGAYERIEGTVDLLPTDLIYHTRLDESGRPRVDPGPLLRQEDDLAIFFFNEINRARSQVHALLLRVMAERSVTAFEREFHFPHLQVFADRNRVEREETFELPAAARDRFFMEVNVTAPADTEVREALAFEPRFHDVDRLLEVIARAVLDHRELNRIAAAIQEGVEASSAMRRYVLDLWRATEKPAEFGIALPGVDMDELILSGASPRAISALVRASRVRAWLSGRSALVPEDVQAVFAPVMAHRIFLQPVFEAQRGEWMPALIESILNRVVTPAG
ncbi:AAA family ATPase [Methylohalobius crimeensis]|uniref:AAA family ATPase n=1 Tax=Methylohalobius crimeensis TaxID=244365 RepID=UPI0003B2F9F8|nr:MoxR family ATPase [Methylohalobius crimeensis]